MASLVGMVLHADQVVAELVEELRAEGRFDEARVELAKAAVRRRVAQNG